MATKAEHHILPDGRIIAYEIFGEQGGLPIFHAHGGPGSRLEGRIFHEEAKRHGYMLIATDRPGIGESGYLEGRRLLDYPHDIAAIADSLGIDRFGVTRQSFL